MAEWALQSLSVVIGVDAYIAVAHASSLRVGVAFGGAIAILALLFWYGIGWLSRKPNEWMESIDKKHPKPDPTSLNTKIHCLGRRCEQRGTEIRYERIA